MMTVYAADRLTILRHRVIRNASDLLDHKRREHHAEVRAASLAANKAEWPRLKNWLDTARNIPLDDFNRGEFRVKELKDRIKQMESRVEQVHQGVQQVNALERLARALHDRAVLQFEVADSN